MKIDNNRKILAITYGDEKFSRSIKLNLWSARVLGKADRVKAYNPMDIEDDFKKTNSKILEQPRGGGYWLWKPYIIRKALDTIEYNEYLFFSDAGVIFINKLAYLTNQLEQDGEDILLSFYKLKNDAWCKRDAFVLMDCDNEEAYNANQIAANFFMVKKTKKSIEFLEKWLKFAKDERIITDMPSQCGKRELENFTENRHDQTVLSLLAFKEGIRPYKSLSGYNGHGFLKKKIKIMFIEGDESYWKKSNYPNILISTRLQNKRNFLFWFIALIRRLCRHAYYNTN